MAVGVPPRLEVVAHHDGVESRLLRVHGEFEADRGGANCSAEALYPSFSIVWLLG